MRIIFAVLLIITVGLLTAHQGLCGSLDDAQTSADSLYGYAKKASTANTEYDATSRARDAVSAAQDTRNESIDAGSYEAADDAASALDYSRKAAGAGSAEDARFYSRQAEKAAQRAQSDLSYDKSSRKNPPGVASAKDYVYDTEGSDDNLSGY